MKLLLLLSVVLCLGCATSGYNLGDDPQDLRRPGESIAELIDSGWEIGQAVVPDGPNLPEEYDSSANDGRTWATFISRFSDGDELRPIRNNAGLGYAIFREEKYFDVYLVTIY